MANATLAKVMSEYTDNLLFADPIIENNIPKILTSLKELEFYADKAKGFLKQVPLGKIASSKKQIKALNTYQLNQAVKKANMLVIPHEGFYEYLDVCMGDKLEGKTIITTAAYPERVDLLTQLGVEVIIDTTPQLIEPVVENVVIEALMVSAFKVSKGKEMKSGIFPDSQKDKENKQTYFFLFCSEPDVCID